MKREFDFQLDAKKFLPLFLAFFIPWLILEVLTVVQSRRVEAMTVSTAGILSLLLLIAALLLLTVLFYIPILRKLVPAVLFDSETFQFRGSIGKYSSHDSPCARSIAPGSNRFPLPLGGESVSGLHAPIPGSAYIL